MPTKKQGAGLFSKSEEQKIKATEIVVWMCRSISVFLKSGKDYTIYNLERGILTNSDFLYRQKTSQTQTPKNESICVIQY